MVQIRTDDPRGASPGPLPRRQEAPLGDESREGSGAAGEVLEAAAFDDPAGVQHQDQIGIDDRG